MSIAVPRGQAVKFPGAGVIDHCELPVTGTGRGEPLEEQQMPLHPCRPRFHIMLIAFHLL